MRCAIGESVMVRARACACQCAQCELSFSILLYVRYFDWRMRLTIVRSVNKLKLDFEMAITYMRHIHHYGDLFSLLIISILLLFIKEKNHQLSTGFYFILRKMFYMWIFNEANMTVIFSRDIFNSWNKYCFWICCFYVLNLHLVTREFWFAHGKYRLQISGWQTDSEKNNRFSAV